MSDPTTFPSAQTSSDWVEIDAVARDYIEGWYSGDVERMDRALHEELVKRIVEDDGPKSLRELDKTRMLELTTQGGGEAPDAAIEILIDDVSTDIATVRVASPDYLDYLHLAKTADGWEIVNVLFNRRG